MAIPLYRPTGQSRRAVRGQQQQFDHDVFEGLPIRRWNKQWMWFAKKNIPPPPPPELPLPKETHLLTPMSQTLLKAARNGTLGKMQDSEAEKEKEKPTSTRLFMTNKWTVIPREDEPTEPEYLGRPPDTFSRHSRLVKKTVNGKVVIVEEELEELYEVPVAGIVADGVTASPAQPVKRRPPPPKRKAGRGRRPGFKKMVTFSEDGRALPTGEGLATPSGAVGSGMDNGEGEGDGEGEGEGEDDVEMGDVEDGTPDDHDNEHEGEEGEVENDGSRVEPTPDLGKTATPEVAALVKKETTAEPMDITSPPSTAAFTIPPILEEPIAEAPAEKIKSPSPLAQEPVSAAEPITQEPGPSVVEGTSDPAPVPAPVKIPTPVPAPVDEAPAPALKSPTPPQPSILPQPSIVEQEKPATPPVNPLKRKSPFDEEGELVDKDLDKHEVSIVAAIAERESHDETLSPPLPPPTASA
ncbi:hypothetical protein ABW20_dc0102051 [Dactylellina cionopaga]|nr:hypothetical protein ABW20_dc0102051 [Dactylellina cionopaga]